MAGAELEGVCFFREKKGMLELDGGKAEKRGRLKQATLCQFGAVSHVTRG